MNSLLALAIRAPSGDNTQPWRFTVDQQAGVVTFFLDEARDPSPMNAGQRMARISVGAALENLLRGAAAAGQTVQLEHPVPPALASVRILGNGCQPSGTNGVITTRVTNRRLFDGRSLDPELQARLQESTQEMEGISTLWLFDQQRVEAMADLIGRADTLMFLEPSMRQAFLAKVRLDTSPDVPVEEGLSVGSLELSWSERWGLRWLRHLPQWLFQYGGLAQSFAAKARQLVQSASGVCVGMASDTRPETDLLVGRAMQRAWLALHDEGLAVQPMMSLPVLENALLNGSSELGRSLGRAQTEMLLSELQTHLPEACGRRVGFILRFGFAKEPTGRVGRRPLESFCSSPN